MNWPSVCVVLLTHAPGGENPRALYAQRTLRSTLDLLRYSGPLHVHIADDGSSPEHRAHMLELAGGYPHVVTVGITNSEGRGYGASYNLATQAIHCGHEILMPLEDDWELRRELDLDPLVQALLEGPVGCIRLGYIGYTQELRGWFTGIAGATYLVLDPDSPEPHVFAGHPRLETRAFERSVGPWPEGMAAGATEFVVAARSEARTGVAWPADLVHPRGDLFAHIGSVKAGTA